MLFKGTLNVEKCEVKGETLLGARDERILLFF